MLAYILRRLLAMLPLLFLVSVFTFWIIQLPPGDFFDTMQAEIATSGSSQDAQTFQVLRMRYGLSGEEEHTLEQIGQSLGLSRERVRQLEARALKKLREAAPAQRLHPILKP